MSNIVVGVTQFYAMVRVKDEGCWQGALQRNLGTTFSERISQHLELDDGDLLTLSAGDTTQAVSLLSMSLQDHIWSNKHFGRIFLPIS